MTIASIRRQRFNFATGPKMTTHNNAPLNLYGDGLVKTTGTHGADISSQRMDELDIAAMQYALKGKEKMRGAAIDLGCGIGIQGLRFASVGFKTVLIDCLPIESTVLKASGIDQLFPISYLMVDARKLGKPDLPDEIALCYSQRFIHYLRFGDAVALLKLIRSKMPNGAKLFLSASGVGSELGEGYVAREQELALRFAPLATNMAAKHDIHEPVCLYTQNDLIALCQSAAFRTEEVYSSPFGNVKGVFIAA